MDKNIPEDCEVFLVIKLATEKCKLVSFLNTIQTQLLSGQKMIDASVNAPFPWKPK